VKTLTLTSVSSVLIGILLFSSSFKSLIRLSYEINKLEIIEKFCINKEETSFECDGKCHLKTTLEKVDNEDTAKGESIPQVQLLLFQIAFQKVELIKPSALNKINKKYFISYHFLFETGLFHPPQKV
jgi:hypothetical protein